MAGAFTKEAAAKAAGTTVAVLDSFIAAGIVEAKRFNGQTVVTAEGLAQLRERMAKIRAEIASEGRQAASRSGTIQAQEDPNDPSSWSDDTIKAKGHKIAAKIRGSGEDNDLGRGRETIYFDRSEVGRG